MSWFRRINLHYLGILWTIRDFITTNQKVAPGTWACWYDFVAFGQAEPQDYTVHEQIWRHSFVLCGSSCSKQIKPLRSPELVAIPGATFHLFEINVGKESFKAFMVYLLSSRVSNEVNGNPFPVDLYAFGTIWNCSEGHNTRMSCLFHWVLFQKVSCETDNWNSEQGM